MSRDEIIRMAREAGCLGPGKGGDPNGLWEPNGEENVTELMFRFAALVRAAEREACAAFLDRGVDLSDLAEHPAWQRYSADLLTACAAAIRARKP